MSKDIPLQVLLVRHGKIDSHQGDVSLTEEGLQQIETVGRRLCETISIDEDIFFLYAPTRRARETAEAMRSGMQAELSTMDEQRGHLFAPSEHLALRNPDLYVGGQRVELVSSAQAMAEQTEADGIDAEKLLKHPFLRKFWEARDRIGYWVNHTNPPGEDAYSVARRLFTFATSLLNLPYEQPRCYICVTHSPVMRAFLRHYLLGQDPGEPDYGESVGINFAEDGSLTLRYRDTSITRAHSHVL